MANKVGALIKEARTNAKLTQEQLASKLDGISASDISKAERGEKELTQTVLKQIAKLTGVTQSSLVNAAKESTYGEKKAETGSAKKKTSSASAKKADDGFMLTSTEKKLVELYRAADSDTKKRVTAILKGESDGAEDLLGNILGGIGNLGDNLGVDLSSLSGLLGKK